MTMVEWGRGTEVAQLSNIVSGNAVRARAVMNAVEKYVADLNSLKGLAFCVSVVHANFMAEFFNRSGLPAIALSGADSQDARTAAVQKLSGGQLKIICSCDVFNEGVDIPDANAILLLRPTQSPVIFQQQIGRGLRHAKGKDVCLVLDFVGLYSNEFRFDVLLRSVTGQNRRQIVDSVTNGFSTLPAGVHIQFDRVARDRVLDNLREVLNLIVRRLCTELAAWAALQDGTPLKLRNFLLDNHLELTDIYTGGVNARSWSSLKRRTNLEPLPLGDRESDLARRISSMLHANDPRLLVAWQTALDSGHIDTRRVQMLAYQLLPSRAELISPAEFLSLVFANPVVHAELQEIAGILLERSSLEPLPLAGAPLHWALTLHGRYTRAEILSAVGYLTPIARPLSDSGCLPLTEEKIEILFVTLDKSEGFQESVQYKDYAISPELFHWQTQNRAGPDNNSGRRYTESGKNGWKFQLFVRENRDSAYVAVGSVQLVSHDGDRPISITWRLEQPLTAELFRSFSILRG
jgi:hypothetical protein